MEREESKGRIFWLVSLISLSLCFPFLARGDIIPGEFSLVAETSILRLYVNKDSAQLVIEDLRNGTVWQSNPGIKGELRIGKLWKAHLDSPFILYYTDEKMRKERQTNQFAESSVMSFQSIERGLKVSYEFTRLKMGFSIKYELEEDYLKVSLPEEDFREDDEFKFVALAILPFFGAASENDRGYVFVPDGPGAIAYLGHSKRETNVSEFLYGLGSSEFSFGPPEKENFRMPVFGLAKNENAFLATITKGDVSARINYSPSGYMVDLDRVYARFVFRERGSVPVRRGVWVSKIVDRFIKEEREIYYFFLETTEATYVGMAKRYREYLLRKKGFQKLEADGIPPLDLRVLCAAREEGIITDRLVKVTSFEETKQILEALDKKGVEKVDLTLVGWQKGGYNSFYPNRLPVEAKLGGERGLKDLVQYARNHGIGLYLEDDYVTAFDYARGFYPPRDAVRGLNGLVMVDDREESDEKGERFILNPYIAYQKFARRDIPKMREYGVDGLVFSQIGNVVLSDRNRRHPLQRGESASYYLEILNLAKDNFEKVFIQGGNMYVGYVDKIISAPLESSNYSVIDEDVPFYQIVLHGLIPYTGPVANLRYNPRIQFLKQVEYGALPLFELTYEKTVLLRRTNYNKLFSSYYIDWMDEVVKEYHEINENMGYLQNQFIQDHQKLTHGVYQTIYEDGTRVIVNYNEEEYTNEDIKVGGLGYLVVNGKEQSQ